MMSGLTSVLFHSGNAAQFWTQFLNYARTQLQAEGAYLLRQKAEQWATPLRMPAHQAPDLAVEPRRLNALADECRRDDQAVLCEAKGDRTLLGQRIVGEEGAPLEVIIFTFPDLPPEQIQCRRQQLTLLANAPYVWRFIRQSSGELERLASLGPILEWLDRLNAQDSYQGAAFLSVNEAAHIFACDRVSLGWSHNGYIQLQAISQMEDFDAKMERVKLLEAAMDESFDQDEEILCPALSSNGPVMRDHQEYMRLQQVDSLLSLPLRVAGRVVGVLTCERNSRAFSEPELLNLRVFCDQLTPRLELLKRADVLFGTLIKRIKKFSAALLGPSHSLMKAAALLISCSIIASSIIKLPYRIEAPFILRSKDVRQISAPFDGFVDSIETEVGARVTSGQTLLRLDNRELLLQESSALANQVSYEREAEQARARRALIEMKIAAARVEQAQAQVARIQLQLEQAVIRSPLEGIVVEDDFQEKVGAPVEQGDRLFTVAADARLYAAMELPEASLEDAATGQTGELAFVSRPKEKIAFSLDHIAPMATAGDAGNYFVGRSNELQNPDRWWRPGMSGIAKIDVGRKTALWLFSYRTIRFLRLLAWW
jgi:RND family efflux transporter MFP subunit